MAPLVTEHTDLQAFAEEALPFLTQNEVVHNLQLGLISRALDDAAHGPEYRAILHSADGSTQPASRPSTPSSIWCFPGETRRPWRRWPNSSPSEARPCLVSFYTPTPQRRRGFASSAVAAACQRALAWGKSFCTLFADLDNPTSTGMYLRLGFEQAGTSDEITFVPASTTPKA